MSRFQIEPVGRQLAFVLDTATNAIIWFSKSQSFWPIESAQRHTAKLNADMANE
jgi:hypothetical protein